MRSRGSRGEAIVFPDVVSARGRLTQTLYATADVNLDPSVHEGSE